MRNSTSTPKTVVSALAALAVAALISASCGFGGDPGSGDEGNVSADGGVGINASLALRTVEHPDEIFPLTFSSKEDMEAFAQVAYDFYSEQRHDRTTPLEERMPPVPDMETAMIGACAAISGRPPEAMNDYVEFLDTRLDDRPGEKLKQKILAWMVLSLQYDVNHGSDPVVDEEGNATGYPGADYKTPCEE